MSATLFIPLVFACSLNAQNVPVCKESAVAPVDDVKKCEAIAMDLKEDWIESGYQVPKVYCVKVPDIRPQSQDLSS